MYGLLAGCQNALCGDARRTWRRHVCGLCESLSRAFGPPARLLMTPDAALLSLLVEAQAKDSVAAPSPSRCLLRRPFYLRVAGTDSPGLRFARSIAVAAAVARLEDAVRDRDLRPSWLPRFGLRVLGSAAQRSAHEMRRVGFDPHLLSEAQEDAARVEAASGNFDAVCAPTERAYAALFAHTGVLAGHVDNAHSLRELGRWFGRLTYVTDARIDLAADTRHRRFNALAACFGSAARSRGAEIATVTFEQMRETLTRLRLARHVEVIGQLLSRGLGREITWACGRSEGGRRVGTGRRTPAAEDTTPQGKRRGWRDRGFSGALSREEAEACCWWWCCMTPCCCC